MAKKKSGAKKRRSPLQTAYTSLIRKKARQCAGKASASDVAKAAKTYIARAVKAGQSKSEATRKANKVKNKGCRR